MIAGVRPDKQKAESLRKMAEITLERLEATDTEKYPSNTLIDYYDSIHKLMEAITALEGVKVKDEGAHQELIDCVAKQQVFNEQTRLFLQQMSDYRNRICYEGFMINKNYVSLNEKMIKDIIGRLLAKLSSNKN